MRIVLMATRNPVAAAIAEKLAARPGNELAGIVEERTPSRGTGEVVRKLRRLAAKRGWPHALARLLSRPLHAWYDRRRDEWLVDALLGGREPRWPGGVPVEAYPSVNDAACHDRVRAWAPDVVVISGTTILKPATISLARRATINMHHGVLPAIRGAYSIFWGLVEDRPDWIGVSIHLVAPEVDAGSILAAECVPVHPEDGEASVFARATRRGIALLDGVLDAYSGGTDPDPIDRGDVRGDYRSIPTFADFAHLIARRGHLLPRPEAARIADGEAGP